MTTLIGQTLSVAQAKASKLESNMNSIRQVLAAHAKGDTIDADQALQLIEWYRK